MCLIWNHVVHDFLPEGDKANNSSDRFKLDVYRHMGVNS